MSGNELRGFSGEVAEFYSRFRRGYPPAVFDALTEAFGLDASDVVVDLGCGTGQLTLPLAARVRTAIGVDPEPDMLELAAEAAHLQGVGNVSWMQGFDSDLAAIAAQIEDGPIAAVTAATAIHWMDHGALFATARRIVRDGGGVAVVTNGAPLWLQDSDWSRTLRSVLEEWTGRPLVSSCGTDADARSGYRRAMETAGHTTRDIVVEYDAMLEMEALVGSLFSAMSNVDVADPVRRRSFESRVRAALAPRTNVEEHVCVSVLTGTVRR
ncbi:Methyltransferase domain-containing protein [Microbacterium sp. cf046]|uniref:class I SAM-dependent methyltransferase n=1 Tax=Microbacterium sp. cf046 TaxID=1761803 RepID=UPI0008E1121C|nr:class I SAM-dependent methyltransferase [Microbacterium sp. cf046]SFS13703.1 Methyltransferase domain-containing protein [Microbacterium sp. cf046]